MADPQVRVRWRSDGHDEVQAQFRRSDELAERLDKSVDRLNKRAELKEAQKGSDDYRAAMERLKATTEETADASSSLSAVNLIAIDSFINIAGKVLDAARALWDFAGAGAAAADVAHSFESLGGAAPALSQLARATAGVVDDTTLQNYAILAERMGLTAEESAEMAASITVLAVEQGRAADVGDLLDRSIRSTSRVMNELGLDTQTLTRETENLDENSRKLAEAQALAAHASIEQADGIDSLAVEFMGAETSIANLVSDIQIMVAEFLSSSGIIDTVTGIVARMAPVLMDVAEAVMRLVDPILDFLIPIIEDMYTDMLALIEALTPVIELVLELAGATMKLLKPVTDVTRAISRWTVGLLDLSDKYIYTTDAITGLTAVTQQYHDMVRDNREIRWEQTWAAEKAAQQVEEETKAIEEKLALERRIRVDMMQALYLRSETEDADLAALLTTRRATEATRDRVRADEDYLAITEQIAIAEGAANETREVLAQLMDRESSDIAHISAGRQDLASVDRDAAREQVRAADQRHQAALREVKELETLRNATIDALSAQDEKEEATTAKRRERRKEEHEEQVAMVIELSEVGQFHLSRQYEIERAQRAERYEAFMLEQEEQERSASAWYALWDGVADRADTAAYYTRTYAAEVGRATQETIAAGQALEAQRQEEREHFLEGVDATVGGMRTLMSANADLALAAAVLDLGKAGVGAAMAIATGNIPQAIAYGAAGARAVMQIAEARSQGGGGSSGTARPPATTTASSPAREARGDQGPGDLELSVELYGIPLGRGVGRAMGDDARRGGWRLDSDVIGDGQQWVSP